MKKHILVVDDEADIRGLLAEFFTHHGFRVTTVATAHEAEQGVDSDPPQLIITDLQLEDSDGLDMIARLKAKLPETPVLLLTGVFFDARVVQDTLSGKVAAYIQKTEPLGRVLTEVRKLLGA